MSIMSGLPHRNWGKAPIEEERLANERLKYKHKCSHCGWMNIIYPFEKLDKKICKNCGYYVYISKEAEFKDKLKGVMKK